MQKRDSVKRKMQGDSALRGSVARGGRLLKWKGKVASVAPSVFMCSAAVVVVLAGISSAQTISDDTDIPLVVTPDEDVIITLTGSIEVGVLDASAILITDFSSDFINRGEIRIGSPTATVVQDDVYGNGVQVSGLITSPGRFENHGVIEATAMADREENNELEFELRGFLFGNDVAADFTNTGQITVTAGTDGYIEADAVAFEGDVQGNVTNAGVVTTRVTGDTSAAATGYNFSNQLNGDFTNSGTITVEVDSPDNVSTASAVYVGQRIVEDIPEDIPDGYIPKTVVISNTGTIVARANAKTTASVTGYRLLGGLGYSMNRGSDTPRLRIPGNFMNSGTITVNAESREKNAVASGVDMRDDVVGNISNSGIITATAESVDEATAEGIHAGDTFDGNFLNSGTVSARATSSEGAAEVRVVYIDDNADNTYGLGITGSATNAGTVVARAYAKTKASATAYHFSGDLEDHFANSGDITVEARIGDESSADGMAEASGILILEDMLGNISNPGTITVTANGASQATANGVRLVGDGGSIRDIFGNPRPITVSNSGEIIVMADAVSVAEANGFVLDGTFFGIFSNTGTISSTATSDQNGAVANGVRLDGVPLDDNMTRNSITNAGVTKATATAKTKATARAWYLSGDLTGDFTNRWGTITADARSTEGEAVADGVQVSGSMSQGTMTNAATITVTAKGATQATARGLDVLGTVQSDGSIRNTGMISATAEAPDGGAYGIFVEDAQGRIENSGTITVAASGGADAFGINVENHDGVISDLGRITAYSENGTAYAVHLGGGSGSLNVDTGDRVTGLLRVSAHDVNLDARGDSAVFWFEDAQPGTAPGDGTFNRTASDGRSVWFTEDEGGARPIYAAVNPIHVLPSRDVVARTANVIGGIAGRVKADARNANDARNGDVNVDVNAEANAANDAADAAPSVAEHFGLNRLGRFASISAETSEFEIVKGFEADLQTYDGNIGVTRVTDNGAAFALGLGILRTEGDTPATEFESDALYLSAAYGRGFGTLDFAASLGFGWLANEKSRRIGNSADARAEYDSTLVTADFGVGKAFDVGAGTGWNLDMNGFGTIRYTRQVDEGYTETGSSVNARVGKSVTEVVEARAGVELEKQFSGTAGTVSGGISGVYRTNLTDPGAQVRVLSTSEALTLATADFSGANLRLGYERELVPGMRLDVSAEQEVGTGAQGPNLGALINWSF